MFSPGSRAARITLPSQQAPATNARPGGGLRRPRGMFGNSANLSPAALPLGAVVPMAAGAPAKPSPTAVPAVADAPPVEARGPLGASMRQPFDYDAALSTLQGGGNEPARPGLFTRMLGRGWEGRMSALGGLLMGDAGAVPAYHSGQAAERQRLQDAQGTVLGWQRDDYAAQRDADLHAARPFTIGRSRVQYDPGSGQVGTLYDGAEDFELYAEEMGLEPGTDEYFSAVEDYVLRSSGPSAHGRDLELDDHRTTNDRGLEAYRHQNRLSLEGTRQGNRLDLRRTPPARAATARSGGSRPVRARRDEPTATGANGETLVVRNGAWVPAE